MSDRTQTIRASVADVQFTLLITIALVVGVIFVFLRTLWGTIIPSVAVPLSLLGACALMYQLGYSLDNISLMALVISVGFVVDDAIVVLENIVRHIEDGMTPMQAACKGAGEIAFTVLSISISLVAAFIPLLLMGGIIGRLFREFAVTVTLCIAVSAFVALTLTPMMASRFLRSTHDVQHGRLYRLSERAFDALLRAYERCLDLVLREIHDAVRVLGDGGGHRPSLPGHPEGLLPTAGHGPHHRHLRGAPGCVVRRDEAPPGGARRHRARIPTWPLRHGVGGATRPSTPALLHHAEAARRARRPALQVIARLRPQLEKVEGARLFLQAAQDVNVGGRLSRTQFQYTLQDANLDELNEWAPRVLEKLSRCRSCATWPRTSRPPAPRSPSPSTATGRALWPHAPAHRRHALRRLRPAPGGAIFTQQNTYHVVMEILPELQGDVASLDKIYVKSPTTGSRCRWRPSPSGPRAYVPISISHQGQFPAITISFNLAQGVALGPATEAIRQAERDLQCRRR